MPLVEEDYYSTAQAARILKVTDRYIRKLITAGELEAVQTETGRHRIPQRAVHAMLESRRAEAVASPPSAIRAPTEPSETAQELRELRERMEDLLLELGRLKGRLELTEKTESTMQEERERLVAQLEEERAERRRLQEKLEEQSLPWYRRWFR